MFLARLMDLPLQTLRLGWEPASPVVLLPPLPLLQQDLESADRQDEACLLDLEDQLLVLEDPHPLVDLEDFLQAVSLEHHPQDSLVVEDPREDPVRYVIS